MSNIYIPVPLDGECVGCAGSACKRYTDCGSCDPPLFDRYIVTFSGLGGDFAPYNGAHEVFSPIAGGAGGYCCPHATADACCWCKTCGDGTQVGISGAPGGGSMLYAWMVTLVVGPYCRIVWVQSSLPTCSNIAAAYSMSYPGFCVASGCSNTNSCSLSSGATAVVS